MLETENHKEDEAQAVDARIAETYGVTQVRVAKNSSCVQR